MFTKAGITELHAAMHERLGRHVATGPDELRHMPISGFGGRSVWRLLVHILTREKDWIHDLRQSLSRLERRRSPDDGGLASCQGPSTRGDTGMFGRPYGRATKHPHTSSCGLGEPWSFAFTVVHIITNMLHTQRSDCRDATNSRIPCAWHGFAAGSRRDNTA